MLFTHIDFVPDTATGRVCWNRNTNAFVPKTVVSLLTRITRAQGTQHKIKPVAESNPDRSETDPRQIRDRSDRSHTCHVHTIHLADSDEARSNEMDCFFRNALTWPNHHSQVFRDLLDGSSFIKLPHMFQSCHRDILSQCLSHRFTCLPANIDHFDQRDQHKHWHSHSKIVDSLSLSGIAGKGWCVSQSF